MGKVTDYFEKDLFEMKTQLKIAPLPALCLPFPTTNQQY
jgi:hypothetical protein